MVTNRIDKIGGLERYVQELATRIARLDFRVTVVCKTTDSGAELRSSATGYDVTHTWTPEKSNPLFGLLYGLGIPLGTSHALRAVGADAIIHGHFFAPMAAEAVRRSDYIFTLHGAVYRELLDESAGSYFLPAPARRLAVAAVRRTEGTVVKRARLTTVLSDYMAAEAASLGARADRIRVLAGGVDTTFFCAGAADLPGWAARRHPLLLSTRRLVAGKGVLELAQAMPLIVGRRPEALLVIAGSGPEQRAIEEFVERRGLAANVRLLGNVGGPELRDWYRRADLAVTPTQRPEPFGLSTVEALSSGTPVVVTPIGANAELVSDLHPGLVAEGVTSEAMATAILRLVDSPELLEQISRRARAHVHPRFSWDTVSRAWADIYRDEFERRYRDPSVSRAGRTS